MSDNVSRTFIGSVVCVDLVGYSTKSVAQQGAIKDVFNRLLARVLEKIPPEDRIILDTGDGAIVTFLGDPDSSLSVGLALREVMCAQAGQLGSANGPDDGPVRIGINLGPMKIAIDLNGYPKIIGDGINVAERITSFAKPGQIVATRAFHDVVSRMSDDYATLFHYEGARTDKNAREHQIYAVNAAITAAKAQPLATIPPVQPAAAAAPATTSEGGTPSAADAASDHGALVRFLEDRFKVGFAAVLLAAVILAESVLLAMKFSGPASQVVATPATAPAAAAPAVTAPVAPPPARAPEISAASPAKPAAKPVDVPSAPKTAVPPPAMKAREPAVAKPTPAISKPVEPVPAKPSETKKPAEAAKPPEPKKPAEAAKPAESAKPPSLPRPSPLQPTSPVLDSSKGFAQPAPVQPIPAPEPAREEAKPAAPPPTTVATPVTRAGLNFPPEAAARHIDAGTVKARLTIDAAGNVSRVQILASRPRRFFDEEASRSLKEWKFNPGADGRTYDVDIDFQR